MEKTLISLKIVNKKGQKVCRLTTRKSKRIYAFLEADKNQDCIYTVTINYRDGYGNDGDYENKQNAIEALRQFLEWET